MCVIMKKLLLALFLLISMLSMAQNQESLETVEQHLTFKGIPIDGTLQDVVSKLESKNFILKKQYDTVAVMEGTFANEGCNILLSTTPKSKKVYTILVMFKESDSWYSLKSDYNELKEQLKQKYKVKPDVTETFYDPYYEGDGYELQALRKSKGFYISTFKLENGEIGLYIASEVRLQYTDKINSEINECEENSKTYDDL